MYVIVCLTFKLIHLSMFISVSLGEQAQGDLCLLRLLLGPSEGGEVQPSPLPTKQIPSHCKHLYTSSIHLSINIYLSLCQGSDGCMVRDEPQPNLSLSILSISIYVYIYLSIYLYQSVSYLHSGSDGCRVRDGPQPPSPRYADKRYQVREASLSARFIWEKSFCTELTTM